MSKNINVTREVAEFFITKLINTKLELDIQWDLLEKIFGSQMDSNFGSVVWKTVDTLAQTVSRLVGDDNESVSWYIWENQCGKKGFKHSLPNGKVKSIKNISNLLDVLGYPK